MDKYKLLKEIFGLESFRDKQEDAIDSLLSNSNTLCLMPTGMGKSLIFQFTAIANGKMAIVFSPLLALMGQQNDILNEQLAPFGKDSFAFNSNISAIKQYKYLKESFNPPSNPTFLFLSPEKVMTDGYLEYILRKNKEKIGLIVVDEAHCVSQWGNSFRPAYKMLPELFRNVFGNKIPPTLCLTATIGQKDKEEIITEFNINKTIISDSLYRNNIKLEILPQFKKNAYKRDKLEEILNNFKTDKVIVYTHIKKRDYGTREMSKHFKELGYKCAPFDASIDKKIKDQTLHDFINGNINVIFATNAFGMGIDIPDIKCVIHYLLPESLEQYYQEVGRAGRNGDQAYAFLLHAEPNGRIKKDLIKSENITEEQIIDVWEKLLGKKNENDLPYIGQFSTIDDSGNNLDLKIFLSLTKLNIIHILSKGLGDIKCFEENSQSTTLSKYKKASRIGALKIISKKTKEDIIQINQNLFELYDTNQIKLNSSPSKVLYYQVNRILTKDDISNMIDNYEKIVNFKLEGLNNLINVLDKKLSIHEALSKHLDVKEIDQNG